jgi:hypothetical protein
MRWWGGAAVIVTAFVAALGGAGPTLAAPAPSACVGTVQIDSLTFSPPVGTRGQVATATAAMRNCTGRSQQTTATWLGRFRGSGPGIPAGCPALDPLAQPTTFPPHGRLNGSVGYLVFAGCTATELQVTLRISAAGGTVLAERTATLPIGP